MIGRSRNRGPGGRDGTSPVVIVIGLILLVFLIAVLLILLQGLQGPPKKGDPSQTPKSPTLKSLEQSLFNRDEFIGDLILAGWTRGSAEAVVGLNAAWYQRLGDEAPEDLKRQQIVLQRLGHVAQVFDVLERHPEVAGLLA